MMVPSTLNEGLREAHMWDDISYCKRETSVYVRFRRMIKTHETLVRARVESTSCADEERDARDADHAGHTRTG